MTTADTADSAPSLTGRLFLVGFVLLTILTLIYFDLTTYLSLEAIKTHRDRLLQLTETYYPFAVAAFIATYIVQTTCSLPGATTYAGSQLGSINSLSEIASPRLVLALTFLGLLSFSSVLYRRLTDRS